MGREVDDATWLAKAGFCQPEKEDPVATLRSVAVNRVFAVVDDDVSGFG